MIKSVVLKLTPNSRFHFGKASIDNNTALADTDEWLHSDVLFSALINNLAQVRDKDFVDQFVGHFQKGQIKISSGFYCIKNGDEYEYLLPKPANATNFIKDYPKIKQIKKLKFISSRFWEIKPEEWLHVDSLETKQALLEKKKGFENIPYLYKKEIVPNVVKHKPNEQAEGPFSISVIQIPQLPENLSIHFYFLYDIVDEISEEIKSAFQLAIDMIAFNGLGGERSSGCGFIEEVIWQQEFPIPFTPSGLMTNLGMFIPTEQEFKQCLYYKYTTRGGRKTKDMGTLERVRMISEGAILRTDKHPFGKTARLSPVHLRYGQPICINIPKFYGDE